MCSFLFTFQGYANNRFTINKMDKIMKTKSPIFQNGN